MVISVDSRTRGGVGVFGSLVPVTALGLLIALSFTGCGRKAVVDSIQSDVLKEGLAFLEKNSKMPGIIEPSEGVQYKIIDLGSPTKLKPSDFAKIHLTRLNFQGDPVFDGLNFVAIQNVGTFWDDAISGLLPRIGEGGRMRFFLRWDKKGMNWVGAGGLGKDETVVLEVYVERLVSVDWGYRYSQNLFYYPLATMLILDGCGAGKPDTLAGGRWNLDGDRFDPTTSPLTSSSLVPVNMVGSPLLGWKGVEQRARQWEWVGPCAGIFVVPGIEEAGEVPLSEFIFGTNTGGQSWRHSYEAISFLDRDNNGLLENGELDGVHIWFDRNTNGRPDDGEVSPSAESLRNINVKPKRISYADWAAIGDGAEMKDGGQKRSTWSYGIRGVDTIGVGEMPSTMIETLRKAAAAQGNPSWEPPVK